MDSLSLIFSGCRFVGQVTVWLGLSLRFGSGHSWIRQKGTHGNFAENPQLDGLHQISGFAGDPHCHRVRGGDGGFGFR